MSGRDRRNRPGAEQLQASAFELFDKKGFDATTIDDIARQSGMSKSTVYVHFRSKAAILAAGVEPLVDALLGIVDDEAARTGPYTARLTYVATSCVRLGLSNPREAAVLARLQSDTTVGRLTRARRRTVELRVAALIEGGVRSGEFRPDVEPRLAARLVLSMSNWMTVWFRRSGPLSANELAEAVASVALDGLRVRVDRRADPQ